MRGIAYCVGVGPGDPELMTQKAIRLIRENDVIAVPGKSAEESAAYRIAAAMVPEMKNKELLPIAMPMSRDRELLDAAHRKGAALLESRLDRGKNVVYITLGDPGIYCTFSYLQRILEADGYTVELTPGIPSFCAAAARLNLPLAEWDEPLHVAPAIHMTGEALDGRGTCVLMKSAGRMAEVKELLRRSGRDVYAVENCGMETEKVYRGAEAIPDDAGYFSLIIAKERHD
ncbi:MAG: precorrin-2 C(20)-methyltransferase [Oscillospiraceae bacterium]|nr:precorrin-2 C(20)-methyltransferase [Oscillospiraceae bacterium]